MIANGKSIIGILAVACMFFMFSACSAMQVEENKDETSEQNVIEEPESIPEPTLEPEPAVEIIPLKELEEWDLVLITDSSGWGVAQVYGEVVAEDTGKIVNVRDLWEGGFEAGLMLEILQGKYTGGNIKLEKLPDYIKEAEVVVFWGNPRMSKNEDAPGDWECTPPGPWFVNECSPETFAVYKDHVKQVFELILELRGGQPTIIRTYDSYNPLINQFREAGVYEECKQCWAYFNDAYRQAAEEMNIPIAPVAEIWNGLDWTIDPVDDLGYTSDGIHPNQLGAEVIAQALRELGYDPVLP